MAWVNDVAACVLERTGTITTFKLHKLLYYAQGWSLAWDGEPLFDAKIKAYQNGPCVSAIFHEHRGRRHVSHWPDGQASRLTEDERDTVLAVLDMYGDKTPEELVTMTHQERPWLANWTGDPTVANEIAVDVLRDFFEAERDRRDRIPKTSASVAIAASFAEFLRGDP